ncbi:MAG: peptidylprolyl isomerase [Deltaproteobacteria bacterium]|nr:peptidylprolyl isomerase [Deltaproteobacteria bacterium]
MKSKALFLTTAFLATAALTSCSKKNKEPESVVPGSDNTQSTARPAARSTAHPPTAPVTNPTANKVPAAASPQVVISTSMGDITVQLDGTHAPITVRNFLRYVNEKFYDNTIFHRVISTFMIQGGGFTPNFVKKPTHTPIKNEATNGLSNARGTIAMARTSVIDSATGQFFINVKDNAGLNHRGNGPRTFGYAVFGKVVKGMDVVDKIRNVKTGAKGPFTRDCPLTHVVIKSIRVVAAATAAAPTKAAAGMTPPKAGAATKPAKAQPVARKVARAGSRPVSRTSVRKAHK